MTDHRLYTGCFRTFARVRPEHVTPVRISVGKPRFLGHSEARLMDTAPTLIPSGLLHPPIDQEHFDRAYRAMLIQAGVGRIDRELSALHRRYGQPLLLLCFERLVEPDERCHRRIFADWWLEKTGELVPELSYFTQPIARPLEAPRAQLVLL